MKCPVCQAKLLPVDGELFCLQCGEVVHTQSLGDNDTPKLEDTVDPILRQAIIDATDGAATFSDPAPNLAIASLKSTNEAGQNIKRSFSSVRSILAPPQPTMPNTSPGLSHSVPLAVSPNLPPGPMADPNRLNPSTTRISAAPISSAGEFAPTSRLMTRAWAIGLLGLIFFIGLNLSVGQYYASRVLPGIRVQGVAVGGWTYDRLARDLPRVLPQPRLSAVVDGRDYALNLSPADAQLPTDTLESIEQAGRTQGVPLLGFMGSWFVADISPSYSLDSNKVNAAVAGLAVEVNRTPSDAVPMVLGDNAQIIADKPGAQIDQFAAAAAIRAAYGHANTASITPISLRPTVQAGEYDDDISAAQAMIGDVVTLTLKTAHYAPTADQIAGWVVFSGPGKGVSVNPAGVANFISAIPGKFDRTAALSSLVSALDTRQSKTIALALPNKTLSTPVSTASTFPLANYKYCIGRTSLSDSELKDALSSTLTPSGWGLGGRVQFSFAQSSCNFMIRIGTPEMLKALDPSCATQNSCRIHNDLAIAASDWGKVPAGWTGSLSSYRAQLINHVVGQWMGFEHPSCSSTNAQVPVLSTPSAVIPGCSPKWYPVPIELQDTKVLPGL